MKARFSGVVYSLLIFISYYFLTAICENAGKVYEASPLLVSFAPNVMFSVAGLYLAAGLNDEDQRRKFDRLKWKWLSIVTVRPAPAGAPVATNGKHRPASHLHR